MLTKILKYILIFTVGISMTGCGDDIEVPKKELVPDSPGTITFRFRNSERTRNQESDNSETLIESLYIALYPLSGDEDTQALAVGKFSGLTDHNSSTVTMVLTEEMVRDLFGNIDGAECRMYVLANLPSASASMLGETPTMTQMKNIEIEAPFKTQRVQDSFVMAGEGTVAYTKGLTANDPGKASGSANVYRAAAKIRLNINLPESITVTNAEGVEETWIPATTGIQCLLSNGVTKSIANPVPSSVDGEPWKPTSADAYYDLAMNDVPPSVRTLSRTGTGTYPYVMDVPFYSFPNAWEESTTEQHKTTMTLQVAWGLRPASGGNPTQYHTYYYQVPVTSPELPHIDRNYSYNVNLTVGMLGSLVPEVPIELDPLSYQVVNWSNQDVDVNIQDFRYLVVNPNNISVNNESEVLIPFYSSHPVDIDDLTMTFQRFNYYSNGDGDVVDIEVSQNIINASTWNHEVEENGVIKQVTDTIVNYSIVKDPTTNQYSIRLEHLMDIWVPSNDETFTGHSGSGTDTIQASALDITSFTRPDNPQTPYSKYVFKLAIAHKDNASYGDTITVTQYPGMYIEADRNPATGTGYGTNRKGNVFINNTDPTSTGTYGVSNNWGANTNSNPNMYVITISQLDNTSEFVIGDPRMQFTKNNLDGATALSTSTSDDPDEAGSWCEYVNTSNVLYKYIIGGTQMVVSNNNNTANRRRRLSYYYPTIESDDDQYKMRVAPKLRIASSYGKSLGTLSRQNTRRRMATYQELNCPAGRWRLPTYGELLYIIRLSQAGIIPTLFNSGSRYWTAQGAYTVNEDGTLSASNQNAYARAVYDEWYWEQFPQYTITPTNGNYTYTLGDMPRGAN